MSQLKQEAIKGSLMIQGTTSDAGKSIAVTGLCRVLKRKGISVAPFKPQNMALNSAVTSDGLEIGRAQALQAVACGLDLRTDFNPVLLKPSSDMQSQVIIHGKAVSQLDAKTFGNIKAMAFDKVLQSYQRLQKEFDVVLVEGAGSPAEINLRKNDIANMGFAEAVDCPVALIADINRGGVFASLVGTLSLLSESERVRVKGFIINQFRGRIELLQGGLDWLEEHTGKAVFGTLPFIHELKLDAEDAIQEQQNKQTGNLIIKVPVFPRISNHTDFEPLKWHPKVNLEFISGDKSLEGADLIILPGTKNVRDDLAYLKKKGWDKQIKKHLRYGGKLLGICGGFQMLGHAIHDPNGIETSAGSSQGLSLFDFETHLKEKKQLRQVFGQFDLSGYSTNVSNKLFDRLSGKLSGYEIHCGESSGPALKKPFCQIQQENSELFSDGAVSQDNQMIGTYVHGLFESKDLTQAILNWISEDIYQSTDWKVIREQEIERLADTFETYLDIPYLIKQISGKQIVDKKINYR